MRIFNDALGTEITIPGEPHRIVSLVSSATEAIFAMGLGDRVVGVSSYCSRYVEGLESPVVGDYLRVDQEFLKKLAPDLVLVTTGLQRKLARRLSAEGYPVYALSLPYSFFGILENIMVLGGLLNNSAAGSRLCRELEEKIFRLRQSSPTSVPQVYVELWFGKHRRTVGDLGFISHMIEIAGGRNIFSGDPRPYFIQELDKVESLRPDIVIIFSEPEYPVEAPAVLEKRGWDQWSIPPFLIESTVKKGRNMIHDGPSIMETASWLQSCFEVYAQRKCSIKRSQA